MIVKEETIRKKKELFDQINEVLNDENADGKGPMTIHDLFKAVDADNSGNIDRDELYGAFKDMHLDVKPMQAYAIFESIDFDGNGDVSRAELISDFRHVTTTDVEELVREN